MSLSRPKLFLFLALFTLSILIIFPTRQTYYTYISPTANSPTSNGRPNAVIFMLVPPSRLQQATLALLNVENRFNRHLKYPYVLFMSQSELATVSNETKSKIDWITQGRAQFAALTDESWEIPPFYDPKLVDASMREIGFSKGYRQMCRFYSGFFWKHPMVAKYDWLWRLDTDIEFHCDVPYDPVQRLIDADALYGFVQIAGDVDYVQPSLAGNVSAFMHSHSSLLPSHANMGFTWRNIPNALSGLGGNDDWTRMCMYNNFEISHRSIWESPLYTSFFEYLDHAGGFFYERWSDSPIHSFALAMALRKEQHQGWGYECPQRLDRCTCVREGAAENFNDNAQTWYEAEEYDSSRGDLV
ncbi:hypothetical protein VNI00_002398 [Paramarasmius palmivorus]|uniref:Glycosyltransferase family 15 protein n=1 Tax=Paramarasmius palmivorus TaxID=297713 RepID=A0AAW0DVP9_9AGAR